ncbi:MAG: choice-of-anchor C family protein [Rivularia sp. (in: cyanobacteria)]
MKNSDINKKEVPTMGNLGTIKGIKWEDINRNGVRDIKVVSEETELVNNLTQGYYNSAIGDLYPGNPSDPLASYFTGPNVSTGAPKADFSIEPDLSSINELGNWLNDTESAIENGFWSNLQSIPRAWSVNTETAIIYEVDGGEFGVENLIADFVVDNSILVWVNGEYRFGIGNPPGFRANDVSLGNLNPGKNYIQIIRSDYGIRTGYSVNITGDFIEKKEIEEPGLSGISIYLDSNDNGVLDNGEPVQVTAEDDPTTPNIDETGQYEFNNLEPGTYIVREVVPDGFEQTFPLETELGENIIVNGSFEEGLRPGSYLPLNPGSEVISGWEVTRNQIDYVGSYWTSSDGSRSIDLDGTPGFGGIQQTFDTIVGQDYLVTFDLAGNTISAPTIKQMQVQAGDRSKNYSFDITGKTTSKMGWQTETFQFTATDTKTTLEFFSSDTEGGLAGPALDNVSVKSITTNSDNYIVNLTEEEVVTDINFGNVINSEKVKAPFSGGPSAVKTTKSYSGLVEIDITGTGQAAGTSFSDSFYRFTDSNGNEITPVLANEFGLYINGEPAEILFPPSQSVPSYSSNHSYSFIIDAPGEALTFGVGDTFAVDNTGFYNIAIEPI